MLTPRPRAYEEMISLAEELSKGIPFVRVDFYETASRSYSANDVLPGIGFEEFDPAEWDERLGAWMDLSRI